MESQIQKINHSLSTPLNDKEYEIATILWHVNQLTPFPLSDTQIETWSRSVNELRPNIEINRLDKMMRLLKLGEIEWDHKAGIQNIFRAYNMTAQFNDNGVRQVY